MKYIKIIVRPVSYIYSNSCSSSVTASFQSGSNISSRSHEAATDSSQHADMIEPVATAFPPSSDHAVSRAETIHSSSSAGSCLTLSGIAILQTTQGEFCFLCLSFQLSAQYRYY
jgi:hypothetical protein